MMLPPLDREVYCAAARAARSPTQVISEGPVLSGAPSCAGLTPWASATRPAVDCFTESAQPWDLMGSETKKFPRGPNGSYSSPLRP
jgi:hypothetical protein